MTFGFSLLVSFIISYLYILLLKQSSEVAYYEAPRGYALAIGIPMFVGMLYILNILPAVPLSLSSAELYHSLVRLEDGTFEGEKEIDSKYFSYFRRPVYHLSPEDTGVYFYASVKAPGELQAPLSQVWEYYDNNKKSWIASTKITYTLEGGRTSGYRAYSHKENVTEGLWRVTVLVDDNRVIGRISFTILRVSTQPKLVDVHM